MPILPSPNVGQIFSTFIELTKELEPFIKTDDLKISFDTRNRVYLMGDDFIEVIDTNLNSINDTKDALRQLMAKHRSQYRPEQ